MLAFKTRPTVYQYSVLYADEIASELIFLVIAR